MKRVLVTAIALTFIVGAISVVALAGQNPVCKIGLHLKAHPTSCTEGMPAFDDCHQINTTWIGCAAVDVIPIFYDLAAVSSVEFGLSWPAEWQSMVWTRCAGDGAVGNIVNPGDGTKITWSACQVGWSVALGYGEITPTGSGLIYPIHYSGTDRYGAIDCAPSPGPYFDWPMGGVVSSGVCGYIGDDPCVPVSAKPSTWGAIKGLAK